MLKEKLKKILRIGLVSISLIYLSLIAFLNLTMYKSTISFGENILILIIPIALILSLIIRILRINNFSITVIVIADLFIAIMALMAISQQTIIDLFTEPGITTIVAGIAIVIWDWRYRIKKLKTVSGYHS